MMELNFPKQLNVDLFLQEYWQRQPLLLPAGLPGYRCPLSAEELAGLACEEEIESRIVLERDGSRPWEARNGPFNEAVFADLPESHWTLLVQDVDKHVEPVAELLEPFRFLPGWRLDDIMISYAVDQGSVGPHIDDYDVFLVQAAGRRRWLIDPNPGSEEDHLPDLDLRILPRIEVEYDWLLEPGDVLYLPPNIPHWGVAQGSGCITCSVGFRTPTLKEIAAAWFDELIEQIPPGRYRDGKMSAARSSGEISSDALERIETLLSRFSHLDPLAMQRWFGRFITEPKPHLQTLPPDEPLEAATVEKKLLSGESIHWHGWSRCAFIQGRNKYDYLFVNGEEFPVDKVYFDLLDRITTIRHLDRQALGGWLEDQAVTTLLTQLYNQGYLCFEQA